MERRCGCDSCVIGEPWSPRRDCRWCWLYWNDPRYRKLWTAPARPAKPRPPQRGPGTELKKILAELGIKNFAGCSCESRAQQMNRWGAAGCREHFEEIRGWLVEAATIADWRIKITATLNAVSSGLVLKFDPADIEGSLVRLAIERSG